MWTDKRFVDSVWFEILDHTVLNLLTNNNPQETNLSVECIHASCNSFPKSNLDVTRRVKFCCSVGRFIQEFSVCTCTYKHRVGRHRGSLCEQEQFKDTPELVRAQLDTEPSASGAAPPPAQSCDPWPTDAQLSGSGGWPCTSSKLELSPELKTIIMQMKWHGHIECHRIQVQWIEANDSSRPAISLNTRQPCAPYSNLRFRFLFVRRFDLQPYLARFIEAHPNATNSGEKCATLRILQFSKGSKIVRSKTKTTHSLRRNRMFRVSWEYSQTLRLRPKQTREYLLFPALNFFMVDPWGYILINGHLRRVQLNQTRLRSWGKGVTDSKT